MAFELRRPSPRSDVGGRSGSVKKGVPKIFTGPCERKAVRPSRPSPPAGGPGRGHKNNRIQQLRRTAFRPFHGRIVGMASERRLPLATADIGIAMGTGTDVAIASAGITLLKGDLIGIVRACKLSAVTMRNIRQNLLFGLLYNALGVPIAAGALYPVFGVLLSPTFGAAAMALSPVSVVTNALRLRRVAL